MTDQAKRRIEIGGITINKKLNGHSAGAPISVRNTSDNAAVWVSVLLPAGSGFAIEGNHTTLYRHETPSVIVHGATCPATLSESEHSAIMFLASFDEAKVIATTIEDTK